MKSQDGTRKRKFPLRMITLGFILVALAGTTAIPVIVVRPAMDSEGRALLGDDGQVVMQRDHWGNFKVNLLSNALVISGVTLVASGLVKWIFTDVKKSERH